MGKKKHECAYIYIGALKEIYPLCVVGIARKKFRIIIEN